MEFELFTKQEGKFEFGTRTDAKASSQGIQRDQFRQFWSSIQKVINFRSFDKKNKTQNTIATVHTTVATVLKG